MRRLAFPLILGLSGLAVLLALGAWQLRRLEWKEAILAQIAARIDAAPEALPAQPTEEADEWRPVQVRGQLVDAPLWVLVPVAREGAGFRVIRALETAEGRRILVDLGILPEVLRPEIDLAPTEVMVTGTLAWPDEVDGWTPPPDAESATWFARDLPAMAGVLGAEPVMVVAREVAGGDPRIVPAPVDIGEIPNDHLNYAITWFGLAAVWAVMTGFLMRRVLRRKD